MSRTLGVFILLLAAILEAGGDALVRSGLRSSGVNRMLTFVASALVLFSYGYLVNAPAWDFGKLLGIYVVLFFIVAQAVSYFAFGQVPGKAIIIGGLLIASGGAVIVFVNE